jgi:multiple sugar transport system permease protein
MFLSWGEFIFAAILTVDSAVTLPVGLSMFLQDRGTLIGGMSATIVIAVIPMMIVVFFFQRYLVRGLTAGGIKA